MTDIELTEIAVKAFGDAPDRFSPLTDDGDALRLAVKLGMILTLKGSQSTHPHVLAEIGLHWTAYMNTAFEEQPDDGNPYAAIRRAIVRAAAEIGKEIK